MNFLCRVRMWLILLVLVSGCASVPFPKWPPGRRGIYHEVKKGDTLWRISQTYGVSLEELVEVNRLPDAEKIVVGQLIFIPEQETTLLLPPPEKTKTFLWPVREEAIISCQREKGEMADTGITILAGEGEKVFASRAGEVVFCEANFKGYGKIIILDHKDTYLTVYAHNKEILVKPGDQVNQGDLIARVGSSGRATTPRLYFEIRKGHISQNPFYYLP